MVTALSSALSGIDNASQRLDGSARKVAEASVDALEMGEAPAPSAEPARAAEVSATSGLRDVEPPLFSRDPLLDATATRILASAAFRANLKVVQTADEMSGTLTSMMSQRG